MIKIGKISFFLLFFVSTVFSSVALSSNVQVQAYVDRNEMGLGDTITLTVAVSAQESFDVSEPRIPHLDAFELVNSWTSSSTSSKLVQGPAGMQFQIVRRQDFNYMLTPKKPGRLTIPGFEVNVEGKVQTTKPIVVTVSKQGSGATQVPRGLPQNDELDEAEELFNQLMQRQGLHRAPPPPTGNFVPKNPNESFFIHAEIDKNTVFEGEQITANWYIYTRGNILSLDRLKFPDLKGFWKEILEEVPALNFTQEVLNGIPYRKALLASHALFPIKAGQAVIDEYKVKASIQVPTGAFGFGQPYSYTRSSDRIKINVLALPTEGRPSDFTGAVGQFAMSAQIEGDKFPVNQPFSLKVRFEGSGNAKLIELPALNLPAIVEIYDTKNESKFFKNGHSYKEFEVLIIPRQEGELTIPGLQASMFDPATKKYYSRVTQPMTIKITPGAQSSGLTSARVQTEGSDLPKMEKKNEIPDVVTSWVATSSLSGKLINPLIGLLYLAVFAILGWKARREFGIGDQRKNIKIELKERMKKVRAYVHENDWRRAGTEMTNVFYFVLGELSGQGGANMEMERLLDLCPPSLRRELGSEIQKKIEVFQVLSFAPVHVVGKYKEKDELQAQVDSSEKLLLKACALAGKEE